MDQEFKWSENGRDYILRVTRTELVYVSVNYNYTIALKFKDFSKFKYREAFFTSEFSLKFYGANPKKPVISATFGTIKTITVAEFYNKSIRPRILASHPNIDEKCFKNEKKLLSNCYYNH